MAVLTAIGHVAPTRRRWAGCVLPTPWPRRSPSPPHPAAPPDHLDRGQEMAQHARPSRLWDLGYTRRPRSSMIKMITARITTTVPIPMYMVSSVSLYDAAG
jgi:hypothetical protein